ncbi:Lrp/AsnC ligand binding domain-containing protein [Flexivirga sp. ID2601S]|uniref:Lrp/AsnC ligand binding domain-containing protein n=1 Tax=Flexivirga aerilata TaxID=1656889 RepID=A0A849AHU4_9MICO|nr:Lrp/AsnC ligand binding domain-containing protein [Flexivirga aerilata]
MDDAQFGRPVRAYLSLTVTPAQLQAVGDAMSDHNAVRYAAAVTGPASIVANTAFASVDDLYRFVAEDLGRLDGVAQVQVLPISKAIKQGGSVRE